MKLLKNKFFITFLLFLLLLILIKCNVFATEIPQDLFDLAYSLNNNCDNYVVFQDKNTAEFYFVVITNST